jgi:hypothetical protein
VTGIKGLPVEGSAQWARITRKLAKILTLLILFETHIFNKTKTKISNISKKFNETNVTEEELSYPLSVLLLYSESLGFITVAEVSDPLDFFVVPLTKRSQDPTLSALALNPDWSILSITFLCNVI